MSIKKVSYAAPFLLLLVMGLLTACGGSAANTPVPVATATTAAAAATAEPTTAPTEAAQLESTATVVAVVATDTPAEVAQDVPTATPAGFGDANDEATDTPEGSTDVPPADTAVADEGTPAEAGTPSADGAIVADVGFRPAVNGFSFENYGGDTQRTNLVADDVRRMFGDKACGSLAGGTCVLTPAAQQWMDEVNSSMNGGHCEGFASLSLVFYENAEKASQFGAGGADATTANLQIDGNAALQREIAYYFATQYTAPTAANEIKKTPAELLDMLITAFNNKTAEDRTGGETYTMGIYQRGFKGGHAITPYAVKDLGGGKFAVMVYDNNFPGMERSVSIDRNANTWSYSASINPNEPESLYEGDAESGTLSLTPTSFRLTKQVCSFCDSADTSSGYTAGAKQLAPEQEYNQVWLDGDGKAVLTDSAGHRMGLIDGKLVNEIPGAYIETGRSANLWADSEPPTFYVPVGSAFTITLDGGDLKAVSSSSVTVIGPGYDLAVDDIELDPGQTDTMNFSADGQTVKYTTNYNESPDIVLGIEGDGTTPDYSFDAKGVDIESGGTMTLGLDTVGGKLKLNTTGNKEQGTYALDVDRIDDEGEQEFAHDNIVLDPNSTAYFDYKSWTGDKTDLSLGIDTNNDGTIDDTLQLSDEQ